MKHFYWNQPEIALLLLNLIFSQPPEKLVMFDLDLLEGVRKILMGKDK